MDKSLKNATPDCTTTQNSTKSKSTKSPKPAERAESSSKASSKVTSKPPEEDIGSLKIIGSSRILQLRQLASSPSQTLSPSSERMVVEDPQIRFGYQILMKIMESGRKKCIEETISDEEIFTVLDFAKPIFITQPSCIEIDGPVKICGDIHGQFSDLLRLFDKCGFPHRANYLFLGDYVDRGRHSLEVILMLFAYKLIFPNHHFLLRGNHECPAINSVYGFYDECKRKYPKSGVKIWEAFQDVFSVMPLTAVVGEKILCMHGGISKKLHSLDQLRQFRRPNYQPDHNSLEIDILWSDPSNTVKNWGANQRGVSCVFGQDALKRVLDELQIDLVVRAHQVVQDGYEFFAQRRLITIFSAPFYCGQFDNAAAVLSVTEELVCSFMVLRPKKYMPKLRLDASTPT